MTSEFDTRQLPRSLPEWHNLVAAIAAAPEDTIETSWFELKSSLKLSTAHDKYRLARAILSFANRDPAAAAPFLDGRALVIIGLADGALVGIPRIEDHDLIAAMQPYLGDHDDTPRWTTQRQRVDERNDVLIIVVDTPQYGDPIYTLRKAFDKAPLGQIFTRSSTASAPPTPADIEMLSRRLSPRDDDIDVALTLGVGDIHRITWDEAILDEWLAALHQTFWRDVPAPQPEKPQLDYPALRHAFTKHQSAIAKAARAQTRMTALRSSFERHHEETRTADQFRAELEAWIEKLRHAMPLAVRDLIAAKLSPACFTVANRSNRFLENVEVELHIAGPIIHHPQPTAHTSIFDRLPSPPRKWGPWTESLLPDARHFVRPHLFANGPVRGARPYGGSISNSGSVTATLTCRELRPGRSHTFTAEDDYEDGVLITSDIELATALVTTNITAKGIHGASTDSFSQLVATPIDLTSDVDTLLHTIHEFYSSAASSPKGNEDPHDK